jgi:hypothetical protein
MQHINFHEIGRLVSDDRISVKDPWKKHEETLCNKKKVHEENKSYQSALKQSPIV